MPTPLGASILMPAVHDLGPPFANPGSATVCGNLAHHAVIYKHILTAFEARLAAAFSMTTYKPSKLGQTDLVFGLRSQLVSTPVHASLPTSVSVVVMICANIERQTVFDWLYC